MANCPICNYPVTKRKRINGQLCCRECETPIWPVGKGKRRFYATEKGGCGEIVDLVESLIRDQISENFRFTDRIVELGKAGNLLRLLDGDVLKARAVIRACFDPAIRKRYGIYGNVMTVGGLMRPRQRFNAALAYAEDTLENVKRRFPVKAEYQPATSLWGAGDN